MGRLVRVMDHRPRPWPWVAAAVALLVVHKMRLIIWYAIEDYYDEP